MSDPGSQPANTPPGAPWWTWPIAGSALIALVTVVIHARSRAADRKHADTKSREAGRRAALDACNDLAPLRVEVDSFVERQDRWVMDLADQSPRFGAIEFRSPHEAREALKSAPPEVSRDLTWLYQLFGRMYADGLRGELPPHVAKSFLANHAAVVGAVRAWLNKGGEYVSPVPHLDDPLVN